MSVELCGCNAFALLIRINKHISIASTPILWLDFMRCDAVVAHTRKNETILRNIVEAVYMHQENRFNVVKHLFRTAANSSPLGPHAAMQFNLLVLLSQTAAHIFNFHRAEIWRINWYPVSKFSFEYSLMHAGSSAKLREWHIVCQCMQSGPERRITLREWIDNSSNDIELIIVCRYNYLSAVVTG